MKLSPEETEEILKSISELKKNVKTCSFCYNSFESKEENDLCPICSNPIRNKSLLCIIANETDLETIEKIKKYNGRYFILGGTVSALRKSDMEKLRIKELEEKIKNHSEIQEIILAINPTSDGETTTLYLERLIKNLPAYKGQVTRLGRGLPIGAELEYADEETLRSALEGRK